MKAIMAQSFACISASLACFVGGMVLAWSTPVIPLVKDADSSNHMTNDQIGWVISIIGIGAVVGPITTWLALDRIGRKITLIISVMPMIVSYVIMAIRTEYHLVLMARCLAGFGVGIFMTCVPLYIGEVAENKVRGAMGALSAITASGGCLFVYIIGPFVTFKGLNMVCGSVAGGLGFFLFFIPESPYYYLIQGDTERAEKSLAWLRRSENVRTELMVMKTYVEKKKLETSNAFDFITAVGNRRAMIILVIIQTIQPFSGSLAIQAYAYEIFENSGNELSAHTLVITMGAISLIASCTVVFSVDVLGRRPLLLYGSATMSVCLITLGTFFTLQSCNYDVSGITWMPFMAIIGYMVSLAFGLHSLPAILLSEYFPTNVKAKAAMIFIILLLIGGSLSLKMFQLCYDGLGLGPTFFICSSFLVSGTIVLIFIMPETKGCSLQKIENIHTGESIISEENSDC